MENKITRTEGTKRGCKRYLYRKANTTKIQFKEWENIWILWWDGSELISPSRTSIRSMACLMVRGCDEVVEKMRALCCIQIRKMDSWSMSLLMMTDEWECWSVTIDNLRFYLDRLQLKYYLFNSITITIFQQNNSNISFRFALGFFM